MKLNNQRLPQKNTKCFTDGRPLCQYILSTLQEVREIDEIYVYCSSPEIQNYIPKGVKYLQRSKALDLDTVKMNEILHCFAKDVPAEIYVLAHATAPFVSKEAFEKGLGAVIDGEYDSAFTAKKLQSFLWKNGVPFNYELEDIPRTQDLPAFYEETCGFYIYRKEIMAHRCRRIGDKPFIVEVNGIEGIDIDEPEDFILADAVYNHVFKGGGAKYMTI